MTYTVAILARAIGQRVTVKFESLRIVCVVRDVKQTYGQIRLLIEPFEGVGQQWVEMSRVYELDEAVASARVIQPDLLPGRP